MTGLTVTLERGVDQQIAGDCRTTSNCPTKAFRRTDFSTVLTALADLRARKSK